jgi:hypothetical protein
MNHYLAQKLAADRARELRMDGTAARGRGLHLQTFAGGPGAARPRPGNSVRRRAGWTLVAIGLRLATTPDALSGPR